MEALSRADVCKEEYRIELITRLKHDGCLLNTSLGARRSLHGKPVFQLWLPLGYHPWWYRKLKCAISSLNKDSGPLSLWNFRENSCGTADVRLAWKNMLPSTDLACTSRVVRSRVVATRVYSLIAFSRWRHSGAVDGATMEL